MTLATRTLRLHLLSVLGAPLPGAKVSLRLSSYQADGTDIVPLNWVLPEDPAKPGDYVAPVWPNTRNDGGTHYDMLVQASGQQLLTAILTVPVGAGESVHTAKINPPPYPPVYGAEKAVAEANVFADASGESASRAQGAVATINEIAEGYGTVSAAAAAASLDAIDARADRVAAEIARNETENLRDGALAATSIKTTEALGRASVGNGESFLWQSPDPDVAYMIGRRTDGSTSQVIGTPASQAAMAKARQEAKALRGNLQRGGLADFTGTGPIIPIVTDISNRVLFGFNATSRQLFGLGLLTEAALPVGVNRSLGKFWQANYTGNGPMIPLVTDAANRVLLGFDIVAKKWRGPGLSDATTAAPAVAPLPLLDLALKPIPKALNHFLFDGQSLTVGAQGLPILSFTQPYFNLTFAGGPRGDENDYGGPVPLFEKTVAIAPDGSAGRGETICSGAANYATTLAVLDGRAPDDHVIFASTAGHGGYRIDQLVKGAPWYAQLIGHVNAAKAFGLSYAVHAIGWLQGENDAVSGTQTPYATYRAALEQHQANREADIQAITGQASPVYLLTYQLSYGARTWPAQAKAQLDLAQKNSKFFLVTPCYHFPYAPDQVHLTSVGYKWLGAYFGRAYKQLAIDGKQPRWLNPIAATRRGKVIRVRFEVPQGPLVLDVTKLAPTTNLGFRVVDGSTTATISSVAVDGSDVVITLAAVPSGAVSVRYALDYLGTGLAITGGASGNLRDSEPSVITISGTDYPLFNVCPHFEMTAIPLGE